MSAVNKTSRLYSRQYLPTRTRSGTGRRGCAGYSTPYVSPESQTLCLVGQEWSGARSDPSPFWLKCDSSVQVKTTFRNVV